MDSRNDNVARGQLDFAIATAAVSAADPVLAEFIERYGPVPPRLPVGDPFAALVRAICYQQLAGRAAAAIHGRLVQSLGGHVTPSAIRTALPQEIRRAGLSAAKLAAVLDLAAKVDDGTVPMADLPQLDDDEIVRYLCSVRGIGRWTAEMFLLFELQRQDVWPVDDLGVRSGWTMIYALPAQIGARLLQGEGERFRPYRSMVALYCWHAVHVARGQVVPSAGTQASGAPPLG